MTETISERARQRLQPKEMAEKEQPLSEQYRIVAKKWVDAECAYRILEDSKNDVMSERMNDYVQRQRVAGRDKVPNAEAERVVRGSDEWREYRERLNEARREALLLKQQLHYINMKHSEWMMINARARDERRQG